jgi:hypothetical protein
MNSPRAVQIAHGSQGAGQVVHAGHGGGVLGAQHPLMGGPIPAPAWPVRRGRSPMARRVGSQVASCWSRWRGARRPARAQAWSPRFARPRGLAHSGPWHGRAARCAPTAGPGRASPPVRTAGARGAPHSPFRHAGECRRRRAKLRRSTRVAASRHCALARCASPPRANCQRATRAIKRVEGDGNFRCAIWRGRILPRRGRPASTR